MVPRYIDYGALHEVLHVLGYVGGAAPNMSTSAHVWDGPGLESERDILFSPPQDGGTYPPWGVYSPGGLVLDVNNDDYLDHGQPTLPDLGESSFLLPNEAGAPVPTCDDGNALPACTDALAVPRIPIAIPPPPP
jgi:hypothetical protein